VTPKFVPTGQRDVELITATHEEAPNSKQPGIKNGVQQVGGQSEKTTDQYVIRTELPGPQRQFMRESQAKFYDRIRQELKSQGSTNPAIFPEDMPVSKEVYTRPSYPRVDPLLRQPFPEMIELVEPAYVCHRRLLFEQPNFERAGWNLGAAQPLAHITVFYYDLALMPYHFYSDFRNRGECSVGKCLPGDPAPFTVPIERFSVTGLIGEAGAIIGGLYLFTN